jgi:hypothetical protein
MIPNFFSKYPLPKKLPKAIQETVNDLKKSKNKEECLKKAYNLLTKKYKGYKILTYLKFHQAFTTNINILWLRSGFLHCNQMNYLLRLLLVKSGLFTEEDIIHKYSFVYYTSPHQYLKINISSNGYVNVDVWGEANNVKFGDYASGFFRSK